MPVVWENWVGQTVDEFPLLQHLGSSTGKAVYLTNRRINGAGHKAAIKIIEAGSPDADFRFSRWQSAVQLSHPHLIGMFGAGRFELHGTPLFYAVMEYAEENLAQLLPTRPLTPAEARDMLEPLLEALAYLHRHGFVQGDLKPRNIMAINDQLKVAVDMLYRVGDHVPARSKVSPYDAPETALGTISAAADVWSLGITLVEGLTQLTPSRRQAEQGEPILPQMLPEVFHDIAQHCLIVDPTRRWSVSDISTRLSPTAPVRSAFATPQETPRPQPRLNRRWLGIAAGLLAIVILIVWAVMRRNSGGTPEAGKPEPAQTGIAAKPTNPAEPAPQKPSPVVEPHSPPTSGREKSTPRGGPEASEAASATNNVENADDQAEVLHQVIPNVPRSARETITGRVKVGVRVKVDSAGNVSDTELVNPGPSKYFARLAQEAAKDWKFQPSQDAVRDWVLRFEFGRSGTRVHPIRSSQ